MGFYTVSGYREAMMEHLVSIYKQHDRQNFEWLRMQVGDAAVATAIARCTSAKPFVSAVYRQIGLRPPHSYRADSATPSAVGEQSLAMIRGILATAGSRGALGGRAF